MQIFRHIDEELRKVALLMQKHFQIKACPINQFVPLNLNYFDLHLRPGIVILSNRLFGPVTEQTIALAGVLQFIYLASRVHLGVWESSAAKEKPADSRLAYQFPVLVGDYLYGKFFTTLCDAGIVRYLAKLADLICSINRCGILSAKLSGAKLAEGKSLSSDIVRGETAELFACCTYLGADLGGAGDGDRQLMYDFGLHLGMSYGMLERGATIKQVDRYLTAAASLLERLPQNEDNNCLAKLLTLLTKENAIVQRMVV